MKVIKSNNKEILRIIRNEYEQQRAQQIRQPRKNGRVLEKHQCTKLNHEEIESLNRPTMNKEI